MDLKRIFRGWTVLAILAVVIVFLFVFKFAGSSNVTYKQANTSQVVSLINNGQVKSAPS